MPLLYYWRDINYYHDLDIGAGYHLNQSNPLLHQIDLGDSLWAFTRSVNGHYVLAAELIVRAKTYNRADYHYGRYRLWGDLRQSRYFRVDGQSDISELIRSLSCKTNAAILGQSFQGKSAVKLISPDDHKILSIAAKDFSLEPRAHLFPEERLEAALLIGDDFTIKNLLTEESSGINQARREYLYRQVYVRNRNLVKELQERYAGQCQICLWAPKTGYGEFLCHAHHIQWLSRGGEDNLNNMVLICPNHHSSIHGCDAPFDYGDYCFDFGGHKESLQLNEHL